MGSSVMLNGVEYAGEQIAYKDSTYELVSKVAFLIGVPQRIFENEHEAPQFDVYEQLSKDKNARIIRNLCIIRTSIERNFRKINDIMRMEYRGLLSMPEIIPPACMQQLNEDGITFIKKSSTKLCQHIIEINRLISDRINNCKNLFPIWINWKYIKELFVMPNGLTEAAQKRLRIFTTPICPITHIRFISTGCRWTKEMSSTTTRSLPRFFTNGIMTHSRNIARSLTRGRL